MITLGTHDPDVPESALGEYVSYANRITGVSGWDRLRGEGEGEWVAFAKPAPGDIGVAELQGFLRDAGFLPEGRIDGICGYRTTAAIRLFQEYVRTVERDPGIGTPDGMLGPKSTDHVRRWQAAGMKADWTAFGGTSPGSEYSEWMGLLRAVRVARRERPDRVSGLVAGYPAASDTLKPAGWDLDPAHIHLVGIRRNEPHSGAQEYDDVFALLVRGVVFKFLGSTDPGHTSNPQGFPFLVPGQHVYRFGWHKLSDQNRVYHALKPVGHGVLVVRSKDPVFTDADLAAGLERNNSINIHWGGEGTSGVVGKWSEGCQVLTGKAYMNHHGETVDCTAFAAPFYPQLGTRVDGVYQTKGAYTVLSDLAAAFSGGTDNTVKYMLLGREDLRLSPAVGRIVEQARAALQAIR